MDAFLLSFAVIFVAELGDKSQLMALTFATRFPALSVLRRLFPRQLNSAIIDDGGRCSLTGYASSHGSRRVPNPTAR